MYIYTIPSGIRLDLPTSLTPCVTIGPNSMSLDLVTVVSVTVGVGDTFFTAIQFSAISLVYSQN